MEQEFLDIYDSRRQPTGRTALRGTPLAPDEFYLVVHMLIFNRSGKLLVQRRVPDKNSWPDMWDISAGGLAQAGETSAAAAEREVLEELGLTIHLQDTAPVFSFRADGVYDDYWLIQLDTDAVTVRTQSEEVAEYRWVNHAEWEEMIAQRKVIPYTFQHQLFDLYARNFPGTRLFPFGDPAQIRGALFDQDGLLLDTEAVVCRAWNTAAQEMQFGDVARAKIECLGMNRTSTDAYFAKHYPDLDYTAFINRARELAHIELDVHVPVKAGAEELLRMLKEHDVRLAVASSTREATVRDLLDRAGLLGYFDAVITGDMVTHGKPHPEIFLKACNALGLPPAQCITFEDSKNGIRSAYRAGTFPIQIPDLVPATTETYALSWKVLPSLHNAAAFLEDFMANL